MNIRICWVCVMECVCARLDLDLYSHLKDLLGNGVRTHVNSKGKIPSTGGSEEDRTCDTASRRTTRPTHYQPSYSGPQKVGFKPHVSHSQGRHLPTMPPKQINAQQWSLCGYDQDSQIDILCSPLCSLWKKFTHFLHMPQNVRTFT